MSNFNVEIIHTSGAKSVRFTADSNDSINQIVFGVVSNSPNWSSFSVVIAPSQGQRDEEAFLVKDMKKNMIWQTELQKKLDAYFTSPVLAAVA